MDTKTEIREFLASRRAKASWAATLDQVQTTHTTDVAASAKPAR